MVVRIEHDNRKHINFYEGSHVGFHPKGITKKGASWDKKQGLVVIVEGRNGKDCVTIEIEGESETLIYLMNDQGKTVEKIFV